MRMQSWYVSPPLPRLKCSSNATLQINLLYVNFAMTHYPETDEAAQLMYETIFAHFAGWFTESSDAYRPTLSYQRLRTQMPLSDSELYDKIRRTVTNKHELQVLESFLIFNK